MNRIHIKTMQALIAVLFITLLFGCTKYLDVKPDQKMVVPSSLADCEALLDNRSEMNYTYPVIGEVGADHYYLDDVNYNAITQVGEKDVYLWDANANINLNNWRGPYKIIQVAGQVLAVLKDIAREEDPVDYDRIKGSALFFRAFALMQLTDVFTLPYDKDNAENTLGLVLRNDPAVNYVSERSNLKDTYAQIRSDLVESVPLLPTHTTIKTRPTRVAALAVLGRLGLVVGDYALAEQATREALSYTDELIDYNGINESSAMPFFQFNKEVIFHAITTSSPMLNAAVSKINSALYDSYESNDLRKVLYFDKNADGSYAFKGKYDGEQNSASFAGIAIDEIYLSLAEALVRNNKLAEGARVLNKLLLRRWRTGQYTPVTFTERAIALGRVIQERKKSLILRNLTWMDLKRLNRETAFARTLVRHINGATYELRPNDLRYAFPIPLTVVGTTPSIIQNER